MKKTVVVIISLVISTLILDICIGFLFSTIDDYGKGYSKIKVAKTNDADIAIIGASVAYNQYVSKILEDSLELKVFNYGIGGQNIYSHYIITHFLLEEAPINPKVIIYQPCYIDLENTPGWNNEKMNSYFNLYDRDSVITQVLDQTVPQKAPFLKYIKCYKYNGKIFDYLNRLCRDYAKNSEYLRKGYMPLYKVWGEDLEETNDVNEIDKQKTAYLKKIIQLCKDNNVKLIICNAPTYRLYKHSPKWLEFLDSVTRKESIPYINYVDDSTFLSRKEWFYNKDHLNDEGATQWTKLLANELRSYLTGNK